MIHLARDGSPLGQFPLEQVNQMVAAGQLKGTDLCWKEGLAGWIPLGTLEGVSLTGPTGNEHAISFGPASVYAPPGTLVSPSYQSGAQVPPDAVQALRETRPWVLLLAILGAIVTGLMVLGGMAMMLMGGMVSSRAGWPAGLMAGMAIAYIILAAIYIYPIIKLFKYSAAIRRLGSSNAAADLDDAMRQQKSFWKFIGILALIMIVIYGIFIVIMGVGAFGAASRMSTTPPAGFPPPPTAAP